MSQFNKLFNEIVKTRGSEFVTSDNGEAFVEAMVGFMPELKGDAEAFAAEICAAHAERTERVAKAEQIKAQIEALREEYRSIKPASHRGGNSPSRPREQRSDWGPVEIDGEVYTSLSKGCKILRDDVYNRSALENFKWLVKEGLSVTFLNTGRVVEEESDYLEMLGDE